MERNGAGPSRSLFHVPFVTRFLMSGKQADTSLAQMIDSIERATKDNYSGKMIE